jgi:hypothetical protein
VGSGVDRVESIREMDGRVCEWMREREREVKREVKRRERRQQSSSV